MASKKTGILLLNLGTPESPHPKAVGEYLKQFLMDPFVIDIPYVFRWFLIHGIIVPRRSKASAKLYEKVWTDRGSPLFFYTVDLASKVQDALGENYAVRPTMRYGKPSIATALKAIVGQGVSQILVCPLYPQYSLAATESSIFEVKREAARIPNCPPLKFLPPFYEDKDYLDAVTEVSAPFVQGTSYDRILFSFHGLPERQVVKTDRSGGKHCLASGSCCDTIGEANQDCYRAHCVQTARRLAERLNIGPDQYHVTFQSRLGGTPWIRPYSDDFYRDLPKQGVKRLLVLCPSFVADCLETLEEVQIRGREEFVANGGEELTLVPSLNVSEAWVKSLTSMLKRLENLPC